MTENEAINELEDYIAENDKLTISFEATTMAIKALKEIQQYRAIGTVEELKALKEKAMPKKPKQTTEVFDKETYVGLIGKCPNCGGIVTEDMFVCEDCLQVLDWEGGE